MMRLCRLIELIESTRRKIDEAERTKSWKKKGELIRYKKALLKELEEVEIRLGLGA